MQRARGLMKEELELATIHSPTGGAQEVVQNSKRERTARWSPQSPCGLHISTRGQDSIEDIQAFV